MCMSVWQFDLAHSALEHARELAERTYGMLEFFLLSLRPACYTCKTG